MLKRSDLPLEVRILQAKRASSRVQKLMAERGWIASHDADQIIVDAEESTLLRILAQAKDTEVERLVRFLSSKSLLTSSIILRAACAGDIRFVCRAMAYLSTTSVVKIQRLIDERTVLGLKNIYNKAGLPKKLLSYNQGCD